MKTGTSAAIGVIALIILIAGGAYWFMSSSPATPVQETATTTTQAILYPAGGEMLLAGDHYTLQWDTPSVLSATTTQIFLINTALESEGASASISDRAYGVPDTGSYDYIVPVDLPPGTYRLSIGSLMSQDFKVASSTATTSAQ